MRLFDYRLKFMELIGPWTIDPPNKKRKFWPGGAIYVPSNPKVAGKYILPNWKYTYFIFLYKFLLFCKILFIRMVRM